MLTYSKCEVKYGDKVPIRIDVSLRSEIPFGKLNRAVDVPLPSQPRVFSDDVVLLSGALPNVTTDIDGNNTAREVSGSEENPCFKKGFKIKIPDAEDAVERWKSTCFQLVKCPSDDSKRTGILKPNLPWW
ncbi:hypothetical protein CEP53_001848 [Fusarium sp. AF-6]|nr:hypothetical protein CEP53_001848 [Fusarium sp. AF-6]